MKNREKERALDIMRTGREKEVFERTIRKAVTVETEAERCVYELLEERVYEGDSESVRNCYSIAALSFENSILADSAYVFDITSMEKTAEDIFRRIVNGKASPITVRDIIEDLIADMEYGYEL